MRGYGGIGRHARFRFWWATVQVQVLSPVPVVESLDAQVVFGLFYCSFVLTFIADILQYKLI